MKQITLSGLPIAEFMIGSQDYYLHIDLYHLKTPRSIYTIVEKRDDTGQRKRQAVYRIFKEEDGRHYINILGNKIIIENCLVPEIRLRNGFTWEKFFGEK